MTEMQQPMTRVIRLAPDGPPGAGLTPLDLDPADFQSPLPEQRAWVAFSEPSIGLNVGVWETTEMQEAFGPYPGDEFIVVLEGRFDMLDGAGAALPAETGQSAIFRNGAPMSWLQKGRLKKAFLTLLDPTAPQAALHDARGGFITLDADATPGSAAETRVTDTGATHREEVLWTNDAGTMEVGIWETGPWDSDSVTFDDHEFAQVLAGSVTITHADGSTESFGAGDAFFIPAGARMRWTVPDGLRKYYAWVKA